MAMSGLSGKWSTVKSGASNLKVVLALTCIGPCAINPIPFVIENLIEVQFRCKSMCDTEDIKEITIKYTIISKCDKINDHLIRTNITASGDLNYSKTGILTPQKWLNWEPMGSMKQSSDAKNKPYHVLITFSITAYEVKIDVMASILFFDTEFSDFHLSTEEGSVAVHKACLAGHSDVFKAMLRGEWKETTEGQINIKGANLQTLQQLKAYMYLGTLPDDNDTSLRPLLLVARCYLMKDLEKHCMRMLAETVEPEDLFSLLDFACENQIPELPFTILQLTKDSVIKEAHLIENKIENDENNKVNKSTE